MNILLICDSFLPEPKAAAQMMHDLAQGLTSRGHVISVLAPTSQLKSSYHIENQGGYEIIRAKAPTLKLKNKIFRAINETILPWTVWIRIRKCLKKRNYDAVIFYSPTIFWGPLIKRLKQLWQCQTILIIRDIFPQWAVDIKLIKEHSLIHRFFSFFEKLQYQVADTIAVQSPENISYFKNNHPLITDKIIILYNWINSNIALRKPDSLPEKDVLFLQDKLVFFYGGNLGKAQNTEALIQLSKILTKKSHAAILLVGSGDSYTKIQQMNLDNIIIWRSFPQREYFYILKNYADIGLILLNKSLHTHNLPGKLLGYLAFSKPILASVNSGNDLSSILKNSGAGLVCDNNADFLNLAENLYSDHNLLISLKENTTKLYNHTFSLTQAVRRIEVSIKNLKTK